MSPFWKDKAVLVAGAGGFIGSHLVEALLARDVKVRAYVRYTSRGDTGLQRTEDLAARVVTLLLYPALSEAEVLLVSEAVRDTLAGL